MNRKFQGEPDASEHTHKWEMAHHMAHQVGNGQPD